MPVKIKRQQRVADGYAPFFLDTDENGISFITFQLEGQVVGISWAKLPKGKPKAFNKFVDREKTDREHTEKKYE